MATTTIYSPMINVQTANSGKLNLYANVVNVSSGARSGRIQIMAAGGMPLASTNYNNLQPGKGTGDALNHFPTAFPAVTMVYCKFTVNGISTDIRGSLVLADSKGNTLVCVEAR